MTVEEQIRELLISAASYRKQADATEQAALQFAKQHYGLRGLARLIGESASNLCNVFNGRRKRSPATLNRLWKALEKKRVKK